MKVIIGLVGENGSGKSTFTDVLRQIAHPKKVLRVKFSDILAETLKLWNIPTSRANLQKLPVIMNKSFGEDTLSLAVAHRVSSLNADIIVLEGARWAFDEKLIRSFPNNIMVYITAPTKFRFNRILKRREKIGEENTTYAQFLKEEKAQTENLIPKIGSRADFKIINSGDLKNFTTQVEKIFKQLQI